MRVYWVGGDAEATYMRLALRIRMLPMEPLTIDDAELIARVAQSDRDAFEQLYDRHASAAMGLAMRILGDRGVSEEVVQESFWRIWKRASSFDTHRGNFTTWLYGIVHHLSIDLLRRRRGRPQPLERESEHEPLANIADAAQDVGEIAWARIQSAQMRTALGQLPEAQRTVIEMAYYEGLTRQEIASRLNEPLGTIHTRARLGLRRLKDLLGDLQVSGT